MSQQRSVVAALVVWLTVLQGAAAGLAWFLRQRTNQELRTQSSTNEELQRELAQARPVPVVETRMAAPKWRLPESSDVAGTMQLVQAIGDAAKVAFDDIKAVPSNTVGKQPFQVVVRGTARQVTTFLAAIEQNSRLLVIENGRFLAGGDDGVVAELGIATYHLGGRQ